MINKNCGIYKITSPTGKVYIGQAVDIEKRKSRYANRNCKAQHRIYNSIKKHGWENHQFDIIEYCPEEDLNCSERFWQDEFNVIGKNGLNCVLQTCGEKRRVISEDSVNRMKETKAKTTKDKYRKVTHVETLEVWDSSAQCERENGICENTLRQKLNGVRVNNTPFVYLDELHLAEIKCNLKNVPQTGINSHAYGKGGYYTKKVICIETGKIWNSITECAKYLNIPRKKLYRRLSGNQKNDTSLRYYEDKLKN